MKWISTLLWLMYTTITFSSAQSLRMGIITDFKQTPQITSFTQQLKEEIQKTLGPTHPLLLDSTNLRFADWDIEKTQSHYRSLSSRCDLVIVLGAASIHGILQDSMLTVPTIALGVFDVSLQNVPYTEKGTSGMANFSYVLTAHDMEEELSYFYEIYPFKHLSILVDSRTRQILNTEKSKEKIQYFQQKFNAEIQPVFIEEDPQNSLSEIPQNTDGVYVAMPYERSEEEIQQIAQYLIGQQLPSFSMSKRQVELGLMACVSDNNNIDQVLKKVAVMVDDLQRGEALADMPVHLNYKKNLYINRGTARKVDYSPTFKLLFTANFIGRQQETELPSYNAPDIVERALSQNLDIQISQQDILLSEQEVKQARSQWLPSAEASAQLIQIDEKRANPLINQAEKTASGGITVQQLIFSEQAIATIKIQKLLKKAQEHATRQQVMDIVLDCFTAYFDILRAKTNVNIQEENLETSKKNLELARIKVSLGSTNNSDIYRWESEVANVSQNVVEAQSSLLLAKIRLNTLLNNSLEEEFEVEDVTLDDNVFAIFSSSELGQYITGPEQLALITGFLIQEALTNYPTKRQLQANMQAVQRQEAMNKRRYYLPTLAAQGQWESIWWRGGVGSEPLPGSTFSDSRWNIGLNLSYPLFDGNRRQINLQTTRIQKEQLNTQIQSLDQNLTLSVQAQTLDLLKASTNIHYAKVASENAQKNFQLVQDNYTKGLVSIIQLLDAQQAALRAKEAFAISVYDYLIAFLSIENSIGFYHLLATPQNLTEFYQRLGEYITKDQN
ncbi:ABC transporter substrate binding protein [Rapidithrix thailandica]|uniref:ABC transporter substrate binding protein n=1 Tax=Rapidithrix thailandica TaxID=413964 RepID=A0AAW9S1R5_9BACT